jgi:hypothetical protein
MGKQVHDIPVHHRHHRMLPVWFFIGVLLLIYGAIILYVGVTEYANPAPVVLANYHAPIWGGILLILLGGFYTMKFWPRATHG